jgi:hypothetical protein
MLNGYTQMHALARQAGLSPVEFKGAIDELLDEELIYIERVGDITQQDGARTEIPDISYSIPDESIAAEVLRDLTKPERRTLVEILNGRSSLHQMAEKTGLPALFFKEGADQLIARGLIYTYVPPDLGDPSAMENPG